MAQGRSQLAAAGMAAGGKYQPIGSDRPAATDKQFKATGGSGSCPLQAHPRVQLHPSPQGRPAQGGCY